MRACIAISTLLLAAPAIAAPRPDQVSQRLLDDLIAVNGVPGMGVAIWNDDRIVWAGSAGHRDPDGKLPVNEKTLFRLASVSKLLAATAAARLGQQGNLDIDAPVTAILPGLGSNWAPITARQLAAHVSGLPHYQDEDAERGATHYPDGRSAVAIFADRPLLQPPGQKYSYSSWGYTLLGTMVEERAGIPFPDYVMREVTPGLAVMRDATDSGNPDASAAFEFVDRRPRRAAPHDFSYTWGGGGMGATPSAIASFGGAMLRNRIVTADTFRWMLEPLRVADGSEAGDEGYQVGFGWRTSLDEDGARIAHHNGVTLGARSALVLWRDQDMAVSLLSNTLWTSSIDRTARMIAAPFRSVPNGLVATSCPVKAVRYSGSFAGRPVAGTVKFAKQGELCTGTFEATGELKQWLSRGPQVEAGTLRLVGLDRAGGLARAGFVTPYGVYDWRAGADGSFRVPFSTDRQLVVRLN